jgi:beta-glucosidase
VPIYYNHEPTGRPCDATSNNSRFRDLNTCQPLYEVGYGLSYTTFLVSNLRLSSATPCPAMAVSPPRFDVTNTGSRVDDEVVQLNLPDPVASISQPVRRLRDFERMRLSPGGTRTLTFTLDRVSDFGFYDNCGKSVVEPGRVDVHAGQSSAAE